jgi:hypothetical protein
LIKLIAAVSKLRGWSAEGGMGKQSAVREKSAQKSIPGMHCANCGQWKKNGEWIQEMLI